MCPITPSSCHIQPASPLFQQASSSPGSTSCLGCIGVHDNMNYRQTASAASLIHSQNSILPALKPIHQFITPVLGGLYPKRGKGEYPRSQVQAVRPRQALGRDSPLCVLVQWICLCAPSYQCCPLDC